MANEIETKAYELAYHLIPELEEADVRTRAQELADLITQNNGSMLSSKEPRRSHLSYPIRHKQYSYFGTLEFSAPAEAIKKVDAKLKLRNDVLRFLLLKKSGNGVLRTLGEPRAERIRTRAQEPTIAKIMPLAPAIGQAPLETARSKSSPPAGAQTRTRPLTKREAKAESKIKTEEIEKEIEEVIKGL